MEDQTRKNRNTLLGLSSVIMLCITLAYIGVPLYDMFCRRTGYGGTLDIATSGGPGVSDAMKVFTVDFESAVAPGLPTGFSFHPMQREVSVRIGEPVLVFYKVKNTGSEEIHGISSYNVTPSVVAPYFRKIQCFCFEEQRWLAGEEVEMPILFYIDNSLLDDASASHIEHVTLSYTMYKSD
jgi:cytochrome c oxidase assembly protein subunit 11